MDSFGEYLKRERELRGVTLGEIAQATNVGSRFLKALEEDDYETLPADVFVKGFLRAYAENAGMDANEVLLAYDEFITKKRGDDQHDSNPSHISIETTRKITLQSFTFLTVLAVVALSSLLYFYYFERGEGGISMLFSKDNITQEREKEDVKILLKTEPEEINPPFQLKEEAAPAEDKALPEQGMPYPLAEKEKPTETQTGTEDLLILTMEAIEEAWIAIIVDDNETKEFIISAGRTVQWEAKEKFVVTLGNAAGTRLKLNDQYLSFRQPSSNVLRDYVVSRDSIESQ